MSSRKNLRYITGSVTDAGTVKKLNQDLADCRKKTVEGGEAILAFVCDGKGGLSRGDVAARTVGREFILWLGNHLDDVIKCPERILDDFEGMIRELNDRIWGYSQQRQIKLGTTLMVLLLLPDGSYYAANVGNSRLYHFKKDHIQQILERAEFDREGNPVARIGNTAAAYAYFTNGIAKRGESFLLCTDGFYQMLFTKKLYKKLQDASLKTTEEISDSLRSMADEMISFGEKDNLSAVCIHVC